MAELFGRMPDGTPIHRVTLANDTLRVQLITYGATVQSIEAPDREGRRAGVVLGFATLPEYLSHSGHFGAIPGRYAGRIASGRFTLDGQAYQLAVNNGRNAIHGGRVGFGKRPWVLEDHGPGHATLSLLSPDGEENFPGQLAVTARYTLAGGTLKLELHAATSRPTIVNLTNHSYFNLAGEGSGTVLDHQLMLESDHFLPITAESIPTGEVRHVTQTPFDFRQPTPLGERIRAADPQLLLARGYDHAFPVKGSGLRRAAWLHDPGTGRTLTVSTTHPVVHLYTANMLDGSLSGPTGRTYRQSDAVCLETQHAADSPNHPAFPSTVIRPGNPYVHVTTYDFGVHPS